MVVIKKIFDFLGIKVVRLKKRTLKWQHQKPLTVEFFGIPGVGKTTLFNKLEYNKIKALTITEFMGNLETQDNSGCDTSEVHQDLIDLKLHHVFRSTMLPSDKLKFFSWFHKIIQRESSSRKYNTNQVVISDEGLFHNFGGELVDLYNTNRDKFKELALNRLFVYCYSKPEIVAQQIYKRFEETGKMLPQHKALNMDEMIGVQERALEKKQKLIDIMISENIPILQVDTSENQLKNVEKIHAFIMRFNDFERV